MSASPRNDDVDMANGADEKPDVRVVVVTSLTRNIVENHLRTIFGFYGPISKIDLPVYAKSGQNRGKAALEYNSSADAHDAASHMNGGQIDGTTVKVELSDLPVRSRSPSPPPRRARAPNGRERDRERDRVRSLSRSSRSRSPPPHRRSFDRGHDRGGDSFRGRPFGRRGPPPRRPYRPFRSRSRSPLRGAGGPGGRGRDTRRSPSYERGGAGPRGRSRTRSRSYSVRSSRSRTPRSRSRSFSRSRSRSYSYSRSRSQSYSRSRSISGSRGRRSHSRDDIRDSRSRSPPPK